MKKLVSFLISFILLLSCIAPGAFASSEEKTKFNLWVPENLRIENWETNSMTLILEEATGLDLEFTTLPSGADYLTKVNMALVAGNVEDLPDVIIIPDSVRLTDMLVWEWAQAGAIIPLTEYYNNPEMAENINKAIEKTGVNYPQQITSPDGNIYGVATYNQSYGNEFFAKMWYSKSFLEALETEVPTTTDEYYALLQKIRNTDINGNGKADEIGLVGTFGDLQYSGWFPFLMNPFVYAGDRNYLTVNDGQVGLAYTTEEWKEGLKYIRKFFEEGLIAPETLTMDNEQFRALMNSEDQVVFSLVYAAADMLSADGDRVTEYTYMAPLTGPKGLNYATYAQSTAKVSFVVTANCKDPEAAFRLGDMLNSELIGITQRWGAQGVEWDYIENVKNAGAYVPSVSSFPISIVAYHDTLFWGGTEITNASWRQEGPYVRQYGIACGVGIDPATTEPYTINLNEAWDLYQQGGYNPAQTIPKLIYTTEEADTIGEIESNLKTFVREKTAAFLMGNEDIDAGWDAFQQEVINIGAKTYVETVQPVYDRMYQ